MVDLTTTSRGLETLPDLARAISEAHETCEGAKKAEQTAAQWVIDSAFQCGGFLRQAKARKELKHGEYEKWIRRTQKFGVRTAQNYTRFHKWALANEQALIKAKPHSLRQAYILAGILREDAAKTMPDGEKDELSKVKRLVRRLCNQVSAHRDFSQSANLQKALEPMKKLVIDVFTDTRTKNETAFRF